jgi:hypothetical protein
MNVPQHNLLRRSRRDLDLPVFAVAQCQDTVRDPALLSDVCIRQKHVDAREHSIDAPSRKVAHCLGLWIVPAIRAHLRPRHAAPNIIEQTCRSM